MRIILKSQGQNPYSKFNNGLIESRYFTMDDDEIVTARCNYTKIFTEKSWSDMFDAVYSFYNQKWSLPYDMLGVVEKENREAQKGYSSKIYSAFLNKWVWKNDFVEAHSLPRKELE